ncbi:Retrovirus-related Pol polyprotein from transposon TNT 1-94 [Araneus ventricosus]|uniref:Retrovirus-related Pol polyprotein from transposon TNT 1-94 n=1 Tax=Araneus ventricosus TaxID=182803 RepID=A0A4Y2R155_ARAVE|nr:Retrovirus-related Pol polyprotein from transposon TNT 1-94 [Araneus ventricosus]
MKTKDVVLQKFDKYRRLAEYLQNRKIKILRNDNGAEYRSNEFKKYLAKIRIQRKLTVPDSPQQNGVYERMNQTQMNQTRCLFIESGLSPAFWTEAVSTAAYFRKKCSSSVIHGDISEGIWSDKEVKINHIRVFGCRTWSQYAGTKYRAIWTPRQKNMSWLNIMRVSRVTSYGT